jgi:hypothetical protein
MRGRVKCSLKSSWCRHSRIGNDLHNLERIGWQPQTNPRVGFNEGMHCASVNGAKRSGNEKLECCTPSRLSAHDVEFEGNSLVEYFSFCQRLSYSLLVGGVNGSPYYAPLPIGRPRQERKKESCNQLRITPCHYSLYKNGSRLCIAHLQRENEDITLIAFYIIGEFYSTSRTCSSRSSLHLLWGTVIGMA